jgi:hypothetical protein
MKYLDTFEIWNKVIKLTRWEYYFTLWIHDKNTTKVETIQLSEKELKGLAGFIYKFLDSELDK